MKNVGEYLKEVREQLGISLENLEKETKIKKIFIEAIEEGHWEDLPDYAVTSGFVKNIASYLEEDPMKVLAMFRRDYPPQNLPINPKPDVSKTFTWGPKLTFLLGIGFVILVLISYLTFQYISFIKSPSLDVFNPKENDVIKNTLLTVNGKTDAEATIVVNNQLVLVGDDGKFNTEIEVVKETSEVNVVAKSRAGKETYVTRKIKVEIK